MITKFIAFESVRDHMTGKSPDDVKKAINELLPDDKLAKIIRYNLQDQYTNKELNDMFNRTATRIAGLLMKEYDYHYEDNAYQWALNHMNDIVELLSNGYSISHTVYTIMMDGARPDDHQTQWEDNPDE